jgi:hypothetical protein
MAWHGSRRPLYGEYLAATNVAPQPHLEDAAGNQELQRTLSSTTIFASGVLSMGRGLILWLVGIPLPVILILYFLGYLH